MQRFTFTPLGDSAVSITPIARRIHSPHWTASHWSASHLDALRKQPGILDAQVAFESLTVFVDPARRDTTSEAFLQSLEATILSVEANIAGKDASRLIEIPVIYGGECGPDLVPLAKSKRMSPADLVALHTSIEFEVGAVGFLPGFAYLLGLPKMLHTPRRRTPRACVPAGTVAIGGEYTGVYPVESPGGWHLIGRTDAVMFDPDRSIPALLSPGQRVRFIVATQGKSL